jgi:hypothetical protein
MALFRSCPCRYLTNKRGGTSRLTGEYRSRSVVTPIVTLTLNPAVDGSADAEVVRPVRKTRTSNEHCDPGGGGINVARVVQELGGSALAVYLGGGATGAVRDELLDAHGITGSRAAGFRSRTTRA